MDPTEPNEPSYYEIALTSRQVLGAFVVLLTAMLVAFFSGVWIGRGGSAGPPAAQATGAQAGGEPPIQEFKFFSEDRRAGAAPPTAVAPPATIEPRPGRTLAEDVGAPPTAAPLPTLAVVEPPVERVAERPLERPVLAPAARPAATPAPVSTAAPAASPKATAPAAAVAAGGNFYVQVISSREESKAKRYQQDLLRRGFKAFLSPVERDGQKFYRVRIGPYARRDQAQAVVEKVRKRVTRDAIVTDKP